MKRKGISPLIAAVLLIAFTMAVASMFAQLAPELIQEDQGDMPDGESEKQACSNITMKVISANGENATIQQETGDNGAGNVTVTWYYTDDSQPDEQTKEFDSSGQTVNYDGGSGAENSLDRLGVELDDCEEVSGITYRPGN